MKIEFKSHKKNMKLVVAKGKLYSRIYTFTYIVMMNQLLYTPFVWI